MRLHSFEVILRIIHAQCSHVHIWGYSFADDSDPKQCMKAKNIFQRDCQRTKYSRGALLHGFNYRRKVAVVFECTFIFVEKE